MTSSWEPRVITAKARTNVSGGVYVFASGGTVSSGLNSFAWDDIQVAIDASGTAFTGIALQSTASGGAVPVALEGCFILQANGTVVAGQPVVCNAQNSVLPGATAGHVIGKALTDGASGGYALVHINV